MRTANTLSHAWFVSAGHAKKMCQKNVRATRSVCTARASLLLTFPTVSQKNFLELPFR